MSFKELNSKVVLPWTYMYIPFVTKIVQKVLSNLAWYGFAPQLLGKRQGTEEEYWFNEQCQGRLTGTVLELSFLCSAVSFQTHTTLGETVWLNCAKKRLECTAHFSL